MTGWAGSTVAPSPSTRWGGATGGWTLLRVLALLATYADYLVKMRYEILTGSGEIDTFQGYLVGGTEGETSAGSGMTPVTGDGFTSEANGTMVQAQMAGAGTTEPQMGRTATTDVFLVALGLGQGPPVVRLLDLHAPARLPGGNPGRRRSGGATPRRVRGARNSRVVCRVRHPDKPFRRSPRN